MIRVGIETLRESGFDALRGKRVGLMTNPSAVDAMLVSTYDRLRHAPEVQLVALFSPEHGFAAVAADGEQVASSIDSLTGLPIFSLYGDTLRPTSAMLAQVDVIVCDIQDIGVRYYTFAWTITYILEAAGEAGVEVMILDRPNPLGSAIQGAGLESHLASIVGRCPIPIRHGLTLGELMQMFNALWNPTPAKLTVIPCGGYRRTMTWEQTGRIFVPPSPAMTHLSTAQQYPGACLIEGTSLSEGRGTALPFEIVGAPHLNGYELAAALNDLDMKGVRFRPHVFTPTISKYAGKICHGVQAHITDWSAYNPVEAWLSVLSVIYQRYGFEWKSAHFDRLVGSNVPRQSITDQVSLTPCFTDWHSFCDHFRQQSQPFWLYA